MSQDKPGEDLGPEPSEQIASPDHDDPPPTATESYLHQVMSSSWVLTVGAILLAVLIGAILVIIADPRVAETASYFFARPTDFLGAAWDAASSAYVALFQGAIFDWEAPTLARQIRPITETLTIATPLILAGLSIGLGFRSGLFNIGGQGQVILGAIVAAWVGFGLNLPVVVHVIFALLGGAIGGAAWAAIAGVLKARFGAHEVIVTIMLNNIAGYLVLWIVTTSLFASGTPGVSKAVDSTARLPQLLPDPFRLNFGFILALLAAVAVWWLMERSTLGFRFRAVGSNARAAKTAGISVALTTALAMAIAGSLAGLGGAVQVLGTEGMLTASVAGSIGFDAITVALLGRSKPLGTVFAGLLFGALAAGGRLMQTRTGTPLDLVQVLQALIVLFIAAPPLVRTILRLPKPGSRGAKRATAPEKAGAAA